MPVLVIAKMHCLLVNTIEQQKLFAEDEANDHQEEQGNWVMSKSYRSHR